MSESKQQNEFPQYGQTKCLETKDRKHYEKSVQLLTTATAEAGTVGVPSSHF